MADTLEELRKHVEDVIRRLSEAEAPAAPARPAESDASLGELERQINLLGSKVERASNMLAQVTDLLESQTERIETLEQQFDETDHSSGGWSEPPDREPAAGLQHRPESGAAGLAAAEPARFVADGDGGARGEPRRESHDDRLVEAVNNLLESVRVEIGALGTELRERVRGLEAHVAEIFGRFGELRDLAWQHRGELRDLEERLLVLADSQLHSDARENAPDATTLSARSSVDAAEQAVGAAPELAVSPVPPGDSGAAASAGPGPYFAPEHATTKPLDCDEDVPMDAKTVRRLEELVEREIRLQQEFSPGAAGPTHGHKGRISVMVVDDLPDARKILSIYLSRTGYHVVTAASAEDCLAKLRHHDVDALVVDASMPGGGGAQVCRVVREDPTYADKRELPIIVYSAYPDQYPPELVRQWKATEYVVKGGDMLPLITALVRHTGGGLEARP